jgi:hypothetical protein
MSDQHRPGARSLAALVASFGLGAWLGSARTVRRVRGLADPKNRKWFKQQLKRGRRRRHPLRDLLR